MNNKKEEIENSVFIKYHKISKWKKVKEWFRKKCSKNKKDTDKELENKNNLFGSIKNNIEFVSLFCSITLFLIDASLSLNEAVNYNIPIKFVGIDMKTYKVFFIIFLSPLIYVFFANFSEDKFDKKINETLSFIFLTSIELIIIVTIITNRVSILYNIYILFKEKIWGVYLTLVIVLIVILVKNFLLIFSNKLKAILRVISIIIYLVLISFLFVTKPKVKEIVTLKNRETKIVIGYFDGEYLVADYEIEKTLRGYEKPEYIIYNFDVQKNELRKFSEVIFFDLQKEKEVEILTLNNGNSKITKEYCDNKYKAYDYVIEEKLKIYKKPIYKISSSDIVEIELKKFKEINPFNLSKEKELQIITLNNDEKRVILSEPNGEYNAFDFEESDNKLIIYKIPSYEIITSDIKKIDKPKKFGEIEYKNFMLTK